LVAEYQEFSSLGDSGWENELFASANEILVVPSNDDSWYSDL